MTKITNRIGGDREKDRYGEVDEDKLLFGGVCVCSVCVLLREKET